MKFIVILVLLATASSVYSQGIESVILAIENYLETTGLQFREQCIAESGAERSLIDTWEKQGTLANDDNFKCYIRCQGINSKVIDGNNGFMFMDTLKSVLKATNDDFIEMVDKNCKHPKVAHLCEAAYETVMCIRHILHDHHHLH